MKSSYPGSADLTTFFDGQGITPPAGGEDAVLAAIAEWEDRTGYKPFLGDTSAADWYFDGCFAGSNLLDLKGGFWDVDSVAVNITYEDDDGTELVENRDYILLPMNAANMDRGWNQIKFLSSVPYGDRCVKIVGKRGYAEQIKEDAWRAILERAAAKCLADAVEGSSMLTKEKQGPVEYEYDTGENNTKIAIWNKGFSAAVVRYLRI